MSGQPGPLELVAGELDEIEKILIAGSGAGIPFLTEAATYLSKAGGKRIRPALVVLSSKIGGETGEDVLQTAAAIEMTHLATLYHDDVIDEADLRRGVPSANEKWSDTVAILAGDYLFSRASAIAAEVGEPVPGVLSAAIAIVIQGQMRELEAAFDIGRTREQYLSTIKEKTAALLSASARLGAELGGRPDSEVIALEEYGSAFGFAFQIADDLLDLAADRESLGKSPGTDLRDGVYTLPVIIALERDPEIAGLLGSRQVDLAAILAAIKSSGAYEEALRLAADYADKALQHLQSLGDDSAIQALRGLARQAIERIPAL